MNDGETFCKNLFSFRILQPLITKMKIVIAPDKFKHSLTSFEVCEAIRQGLADASTDFEMTMLPLADGGDGLADVLAYYHPFEKISATVCNPLWKPIEASFLFSEKESLAFVEMAQASGLRLLQPPEYNCALTTTYGTGELVKKALENGVKKTIIGIGGSATNDCGIGMAAALGFRFLDKHGKEVEPIGKNLSAINAIDASRKMAFQNVEFVVACDVDNYLTGAEGATKIYGPQKGATPETIESLEAGMNRFAAVVKKELGVDIKTIKGGGAAGGLGAGCVAFLGAKLESGAELAFRYSSAEEQISQADLVVTGEGKMDAQTANGKLVDAVAKLAAKYNTPVMAFCGTLALSPEQLRSSGIASAFAIIHQPMVLEEAMQNAFALLKQRAFEAGCLLIKNEL